MTANLRYIFVHFIAYFKLYQLYSDNTTKPLTIDNGISIYFKNESLC